MRLDQHPSPVIDDSEKRLYRLGALGRALAATFVVCAVAYVALVAPSNTGGSAPRASAVDPLPAAAPAAEPERSGRDGAVEMPGADPLYVDPVASSAG
jgi:hypothetical protein